MRLLVLAALAAAAIFAAPTISQAQVGDAHFRAWDSHDRGGRAATPRRAVRHHRHARVQRTRGRRVSPRRAYAAIPRATAGAIHRVTQGVAGVVGVVPNPACPAWVMRGRVFCGCGVSIRVFGTAHRHLFTARAWLRFPPASPAPGMIAANHRHVFYIERVLGNGRVLAYDPNSGGGRTRIHVRSLAGFSVRNPRA